MAAKAKFGHCEVSYTGENASLWRWCIELKTGYKKIQNNQKPNNKLSDEQIQRLDDACFKWSQQKGKDKAKKEGREAIKNHHYVLDPYFSIR